MKKIWILLLVFAVLLGGCVPPVTENPTEPPYIHIPTQPTEPTGTTEPTGATQPTGPACQQHMDDNRDDVCDVCFQTVIVYIDFYSINDLHGKFVDSDTQIGVDELTTFLKKARQEDDYAFFLSAGDMWQGGAESNMTKGQIMTDWMNALDFTAMTIGNHEYDWGSEHIRANSQIAEFPFLAINIYDSATNERVDYCEPSVVVEAGGLQIGIIGAMGNHYTSIAPDKCADVYFKTGSQLTALVKEESTRLQAQGVDFIVYVIHSDQSDYDSTLSSGGYVDLVFEGHTHQGYCKTDSYGIYHLQNKGDNQDGLSHVEIAINSVTNDFKVQEAGQISKSKYQNMADDPIVEELLEKYKDVISDAYATLGYNSAYRSSTALGNIVAELYYKAGVEKWGDQYNIVLGGGSLKTRSPYNLPVGEVTYADLQALFTFDNELRLCSIKGSDLLRRFYNNSDYRIYSPVSAQSINANETYYIIVDTWSSDYAPNKLTTIAKYDAGVFARDLLAEYVKEGGLS